MDDGKKAAYLKLYFVFSWRTMKPQLAFVLSVMEEKSCTPGYNRTANLNEFKSPLPYELHPRVLKKIARPPQNC